MTARDRKSRKLSSIRLTRKFHLRYMGLWIALTILLCILVTYICYRMVELPAADVYSMEPAALTEYINSRTVFLVGMLVEVIVVSALIVLLASLTAHRVAGPYIRLIAVCEALRDGDLDQRLKFRRYDNLETVETAFNAMLDNMKTHFEAKDGESN